KNKQNAVKAMILTDAGGKLLFCSPAQPASCAGITHARQSGLVKHLTGGPAVEILADAGYQGLGAQTGGRVVTPPHRKFKKNPPEWYEEVYERQRKAHSSRRIRVEHGIAHLKNWRALARHLGRREQMSDTIQAVAGLLSHQQTVTRGARQPQHAAAPYASGWTHLSRPNGFGMRTSTRGYGNRGRRTVAPARLADGIHGR
ncbi:transposase family protein, partial [Streptomyces lavendulae]|uniref:transposase family protein n=1 Tax=Streptomyces lavendulae TaxID=1914 RepID=UPI0033E09B64